jgi:hypothetical protein
MNMDLLVALVTVVPTTLAVVVGFLVNLRSVRYEVAAPLRESIRRLDDKVDRLADGLTEIRERLAHLEGSLGGQGRELWVPDEKS